MARIRTIKPDFFRHEGLQDLEAANPQACCMLVFAGLWGHCDKAGRFEWKPRMLKLDILPFLPFDMAETLALLEQSKFVRRYAVEGKEYGVIDSFSDHQRVGGKEAQEEGKYPEPNGEESEKQRGSNGEAEGIAGREGKGMEGKAGKPRLLPLPDSWSPSELSVAWCSREFGLRVPEDVDRYVVAFRDACKAKGYTYVDHDAAFKNCVRQDWPKFRGGKPRLREGDGKPKLAL